MPFISSRITRWLTPGALLAAVVIITAPAAHASTVAAHLSQPKKLSVTADGDLVVALSGDGRAPKACSDGEQVACLDHSGAVDLITPAGHVTRLRSGLASVAESHTDPQATGPVQAQLSDGKLRVLFQNTSINQTSGKEIYGSGGQLMDTLTTFANSGHGRSLLRIGFGPFEALHNPDHGEGTNVTDGEDAARDSDPYGFVSYRGGTAVVDAGANDVLWVSPTGRIQTLAVLPTIRERAAAGTFGSEQKKAIEAAAQPVPDAITVGPDGALYVGEFGGEPYDSGTSSIYRVTPGHKATRVASGFDAIDDMTFDSSGRLLVLELDRKGLSDPGLAKNDPASGALYSVNPSTGARRLLRAKGLTMATGLAYSDGNIYVAVNGVSSSNGKIVRFAEPS